MQRAQKIFSRCILIIIALSILIAISVQLPFVQKILITKTANQFSSEFGVDVELDGVCFKPFSCTVSIKGISCSSFLVDASCSEIDISGWDLIKNHGQIKSANFKNLTWDIMGNIVGSSEHLELDGIEMTSSSFSISSARVSGLETSTGGYGPDTFHIQELTTGINYNNSLRLDLDTLIGDSIDASGILKINPSFVLDADLNINTYPNYFIHDLGFDLGQTSGHVQYKDSTIFIENLRSSKGHFIEEGQIQIDLKEWSIKSSTILENQLIHLEFSGSQNTANGSATLEGYGDLDFIVSLSDSTFVAEIESSKINIQGNILNNLDASITGNMAFDSCSINMSSSQLNIKANLNPIEFASTNFISSGFTQIKDPNFLSQIIDHSIKTGPNTTIEWKILSDESQVDFSSDFISSNGIRLSNVSFSGDPVNLNGIATCEELMILTNGKTAKVASSLITQISNENNLEINSTWKSTKGIDGALKIEGTVDEEVDLSFNMITEPITEDQTSGWFGIPLETPGVEIDGKITGDFAKPKISINTHSTNFRVYGELVKECDLSISQENGRNRVTARLTGLGELETGSITILGSFDLESLDLTTAINELPISYFNPFLAKNTATLDGYLHGVFSIGGSFKSPIISGNGTIDNCIVEVDYLGTQYRVNGGFDVEPDAIELNGLNVDDGKGGGGFLVGTVLHDQFRDWNIDVSLSAEENPIELMNIPYSPERYFYGTGKGVGDFNVFGYEEHIVIEANIITSEGTEFVLPMDVVSSGKWSSFIEIKGKEGNISENIKAEEEQKTQVSLDINVEATPDSKARIVFDSDLGDEITGRCRGHLHIDLHDLERLEMFGDLEIVEGEYAFNLKNIISKKFEAVPGGTIRWFGDPYNAHIDISTTYKTRASLRPILPEITDASKYDIKLVLNLQGELLRPGILFDIGIPEASAQYRASLASIFSNEEEMNRQAVSLLVINSFLPSTWHASAVGSTGIQESSSELITSQIGHWLSSISEDVNVGIDYDSKLSTGDEAAIAVALSTQLFNDRLHIEGEVGTQNLYSGTTDDLQIQDVKIKYDIKEDGTLQLTGYSTQKATIPGLEGESVQGVGILFNRDFESIRDLFKRKSKKN